MLSVNVKKIQRARTNRTMAIASASSIGKRDISYSRSIVSAANAQLRELGNSIIQNQVS